MDGDPSLSTRIGALQEGQFPCTVLKNCHVLNATIKTNGVMKRSANTELTAAKNNPPKGDAKKTIKPTIQATPTSISDNPLSLLFPGGRLKPKHSTECVRCKGRMGRAIHGDGGASSLRLFRPPACRLVGTDLTLARDGDCMNPCDNEMRPAKSDTIAAVRIVMDCHALAIIL
jgi:hypothetical protein